MIVGIAGPEAGADLVDHLRQEHEQPCMLLLGPWLGPQIRGQVNRQICHGTHGI